MKHTALFLSLLFLLPAVSNAQWEYLSGPFGGSVHAITHDTLGNLYAGTDIGVFRSTDDGESWNMRSEGLPRARVHEFHFIGATLFAATNQGVFISTNEGTSWSNRSTGLPNSAVSSFTSMGSILFAATLGGGVYRSNDFGTTWHAVNNGLPNTDLHSIVVSGSNLIVGSSGYGPYVSSDSGASWSSVDSNVSAVYVTCFAVVNDMVFMGSSNKSLFRSSDNGMNWTVVKTFLPSYSIRTLGVSGSTLFLALFDNDMVYDSAYTVLYRSTDFGERWKPANMKNVDINVITFKDSSLFLGTIDHGIYRSTDNASPWLRKSYGLQRLPVTSIAVVDSHVFAGTKGGLFRMNDDDTSWTDVNAGNMRFAGKHVSVIGSRLFIGTSLGVFMTSDYGETWDSTSTGLPHRYVWQLASDSVGNLWVSMMYGLLLSTDYGASWTVVNSDQGWWGYISLSLAVSDSIVALATRFGGVQLSRDKGNTWISVHMDINLGLIMKEKVIVSGELIFSPSVKGILYVPRYATSWEIFKSGLAKDTVKFIAPGPTGYIYAVTSRNGVFLLSHRGDSWVDIGSGFTDSLVSSLIHVNTKEGPVLYVGANNGVWRRIHTTLTPVSPVLLFPFDGSKSLPLNPVLEWKASPGAMSYRLQVSTDQTFQAIIVDKSNLKIASLLIMRLLPGTKYYWRVNATNFIGTSGWSTVWTFTTIVYPPDIPKLLLPQDNATNIPVDATFTWNAASGAESYSLKIAVDPTFMSPLVFSKSGMTDTLQAVSGLPNAKRLYWTVNASNSSGSSAWSEIWSFTTASINEVGSPANLPQDIELHQNHPNPFAEKTTIRFKLVVPGRVTLEVFDLFGRWVATLVDEKREAGEHSVVLNAARLSNGIYVYRLTANGRSAMKLAVVAK